MIFALFFIQTFNDVDAIVEQVKETVDATLNRISSSGVSGASYFTGSIIGTTRCVCAADHNDSLPRHSDRKAALEMVPSTRLW